MKKRDGDDFKILLINPCVSQEAVYGRFLKFAGAILPPLGLSYLAAVLEKEKYSVTILDANLLYLGPRQVVERVKNINPDVVGLYATTLGIEAAEGIAAQIKSVFPSLPIVVGGPHVSGYGRKTLDFPSFDFGVVGEGEYSFLNLVRRLEKQESDFGGARGIIYRNGKDILAGEPMPLIENLDDLPPAARHLLPSLRNYRPQAFLFRDLPLAHIFTSRGCPYQCIFCQTPFGKKVRFHSASYVAEEITDLMERHGVRELRINDDTFHLDEKRVADIFSILNKRDKRIAWSCNLRADTIKNKDFLKTMKENGCWLIRLGVESGSQMILNGLKKHITLEQVERLCRWAREAGIKIHASFIIGNPYETRQTMEETIDFAMSLPLDFVAFAFMTPFPGTELWEKARDLGDFSYNKFSDLALSHNPTFVPKGLDREDLIHFQKLAYRRFYLHPRAVGRIVSNINICAETRRLASVFGEWLK